MALRAVVRAGVLSSRNLRLWDTLMNALVDSFPPEVADKLSYYVYRLIDPRNGETFYVGKGRGDRVFAHARAEIEVGPDSGDDEIGEKLKRIRDIRLAGFEVGHVIHRHGMDERTAFEVEAALIDAYPGTANIAGGTTAGTTAQCTRGR